MRTRGAALDGVEQGPLDLAPRHVGRVRDAARAVAALEVQVEVRSSAAGALGPVEAGADGLQRRACARAPPHADLDGALVAEPGARPRACP